MCVQTEDRYNKYSELANRYKVPASMKFSYRAFVVRLMLEIEYGSGDQTNA